jgi:multidrug efflux pump subunit AcrA (membrane-fusion protein)
MRLFSAANALILPFALLLGACTGKENQAPLGKVERRDLVQRVTIAGGVIPKRRTLVTAPYDGYVKQLFVKVGDEVKAGQPLVSVTQSLLSTEPVFPLRAPYAGTVVHVQKYEGENVKNADVNGFIMRVDDLSKLYVQANVPEVDRSKLKVGQETLIKASAVTHRSYKGKITELTLAPKEGEGQNQLEYPLRIEVLDNDKSLGPGMSVVVDIITAKRDAALTLRHEYVTREPDGYFVILENGEKKKIEVGMQNEEAFEITSGLEEGQRVRQIDFAALPENN